MKTDPVIDRIRKARCLISEKYGHDPKRLVEYYMTKQNKDKKRLKNCNEETEIEAVSEKANLSIRV